MIADTLQFVTWLLLGGAAVGALAVILTALLKNHD